jgi:thiol-disulfide isomerase/thioredoxin
MKELRTGHRLSDLFVVGDVVKRIAAALLAVAVLGAAADVRSIERFDGATRWINSAPLDQSSLHGKVVLVDFWEYTCINCLRTLPYLREWYKRYANDGFVIVGVQTPEFGFSGDSGNVKEAVERLGITWPVAVDSDRAIWNRYGVTGWPMEFLFDQNGTLVEKNAGEGNYQITEGRIQELLRQQNPQLHLPPVMALLPQDSYDKPGAICYPQTKEILVEANPIADPNPFGNVSQDLSYTDTGKHQDGRMYLQGYWRSTDQALLYGGGDGYFDLPYHAIQVMVVMTPPQRGSGRVDVTQDGKPIAKEDAGPDIHYDAGGMSYVTVDASRAYELLMNQTFGEHDLRLAPQSYGLGIYDIAFESCEVPGSAK